MNRIKLVKGDITQLQTDAIVNAANSSLTGGGGVDGAIHRAGGKIVLEECKKYVSKFGPLPTGQAMITSGGNLPAKFVIHTVGPVWQGGTYHEESLLSKTYFNTMNLAVEKKLCSIAFPNISTGVYRFPKEKAAGIALTTVGQFLKSNMMIGGIFFVCFDEENFRIYQGLMNSFE